MLWVMRAAASCCASMPIAAAARLPFGWFMNAARAGRGGPRSWAARRPGRRQHIGARAPDSCWRRRVQTAWCAKPQSGRVLRVIYTWVRKPGMREQHHDPPGWGPGWWWSGAGAFTLASELGELSIGCRGCRGCRGVCGVALLFVFRLGFVRTALCPSRALHQGGKSSSTRNAIDFGISVGTAGRLAQVPADPARRLPCRPEAALKPSTALSTNSRKS